MGLDPGLLSLDLKARVPPGGTEDLTGSRNPAVGLRDFRQASIGCAPQFDDLPLGNREALMADPALESLGAGLKSLDLEGVI